MASDDTLAVWIGAARRTLKSGGVLTLIWRADGLSDVLSTLERGFGGIEILPVYPTPEAPAIRILAKAIKGSRAPMMLHPALLLEGGDGAPTAEARAVLDGTGILPSLRRPEKA